MEVRSGASSVLDAGVRGGVACTTAVFTRIHLENWKNFTRAEAKLGRRVFVVGPNASGKSNFLDALRFLRDVAEPQGGLQRAVALRQSISQLRSLHARRYPAIVIEVDATIGDVAWGYRLELTQDNNRVPKVERETIRRAGTVVGDRPSAESGPESTHADAPGAGQRQQTIP